MNKTKGFLRIGIVLSVLWLFFLSLKYDIWYWGIEGDFVAEGIAPLVIFWGLVWVIAGFRNIVSGSRNEDNNNQDK